MIQLLCDQCRSVIGDKALRITVTVSLEKADLCSWRCLAAYAGRNR